MKKLIFLFIGMLMAVDVFSQDYTPTVNWPYLYPDFMEGELVRARNKRNKAQFNIHEIRIKIRPVDCRCVIL